LTPLQKRVLETSPHNQAHCFIQVLLCRDLVQNLLRLNEEEFEKGYSWCFSRAVFLIVDGPFRKK
jgi:hypothetical protein